jgi:hypothetical protein
MGSLNLAQILKITVNLNGFVKSGPITFFN